MQCKTAITVRGMMNPHAIDSTRIPTTSPTASAVPEDDVDVSGGTGLGLLESVNVLLKRHPYWFSSW